MNELAFVKDKLEAHFPEMKCSYDPAENEKGSSWLELRLKDQDVTVEWRPNSGFGLYVKEDDESYGIGPDEIYRNIDSMITRLIILLEEHRVNLKLKEIRELLGISQNELASLLDKQQGSISKIESRESDVLFKTLCNVINALGGTLEIKAHFDAFDVPLNFSCDKNEDKQSA